MLFVDRREAGGLLGQRLLSLQNAHPVVLALPRGGVAIGVEVARALAAPLDLVLVRKIGAPGHEELAVGAVADGGNPELVTESDLHRYPDVLPKYLETAKTAALQEIERRRRVYLGDQAPLDLTGRTAIVIDDGIATGATMLAALRATRRRKPARLVLAVPVAPHQILERLRQEADQTVCLDTPADFFAVGQYYRQFPQLSDAEVIALLNEARGFAAPAPA